MSNVSLDHQRVLAAGAETPRGVSVTMMNLVAFNAEAEYEGSKETPCCGVEAYLQRYALAFNEVAAELGVTRIEVIYVGSVVHTILGPEEPRWDALALVRYPSFAAMRKVIESPLYLEKAEPHRKSALKAWEVLPTFQQPVAAP